MLSYQPKTVVGVEYADLLALTKGHLEHRPIAVAPRGKALLHRLAQLRHPNFGKLNMSESADIVAGILPTLGRNPMRLVVLTLDDLGFDLETHLTLGEIINRARVNGFMRVPYAIANAALLGDFDIQPGSKIVVVSEPISVATGEKFVRPDDLRLMALERCEERISLNGVYGDIARQFPQLDLDGEFRYAGKPRDHVGFMFRVGSSAPIGGMRHTRLLRPLQEMPEGLATLLIMNSVAG